MANSSNIKIIGETINEKTSEILPYVHIGVVGATIGTASDYKGRFSLDIPDEFKSFNLHISSIGFETITLKISEIKADTLLRIRLMPTQYSLNEVDVSAQSRLLYGIIKDASSKISKNYPSSSIIYPFNFTSKTKVKNTVREMSAKGELYDSLGYRRQTFYDAMASRSYRFENNAYQKEKEFAFYKGITVMDELLNFDLVKTTGNVLDQNHIDKYSLNLLSTTTYENESVYVISYKNLEPSVISTGDYYATSYEGEIYISKTSLAILRNTTRVKSTLLSLYGRSMAVGKDQSPMGTDVAYEFTTTYQPYNGQHILSTVAMKFELNNSRGERIINNSELIIEGFKKVSVQNVPSRDLLKPEK